MSSKKALFVLVVVLVVGACVAALGTGCATESGGEDATENATQNDGGEGADTTDGDDAGDTSQSELEDDAIGTARAWFVAKTEFTADQFEWAVEGFAQAEDGSYYARVSATPIDQSLETEQVYVEKPADMELWYPIDMGTGIDPATDDRFPEEVRDQL